MSWHHFFFSFFFFAFPSYISGVHHFWVRFVCMWPFFNPTIKVVTFHLCGWCVLDVFLLPAFTRLGHERQNLLSLCDEMHICSQTRPRFILSSKRVFGGMEFEPMLTPREKSLYQKISPEEDRTRDDTTQLSYRFCGFITCICIAKNTLKGWICSA